MGLGFGVWGLGFMTLIVNSGTVLRFRQGAVEGGVGRGGVWGLMVEDSVEGPYLAGLRA